MATVINNPDSGSNGGAGGWIMAAVVLVIVALVALFVWPGYGRGGTAPAASTQVNVQIPSGGSGGGAPAQ